MLFGQHFKAYQHLNSKTMWRFTQSLSRGFQFYILGFCQRIQDVLRLTNSTDATYNDLKSKYNDDDAEKRDEGPNFFDPTSTKVFEPTTSDASFKDSIFESLRISESQTNHAIGLAFLKKEEYSQALTWIKSSSSLGNEKAYFNLALMYELGLGVSKDLKKAKEYYTKSADAGHPQAQFNLAIYWDRGWGDGQPSIAKSQHYLHLYNTNPLKPKQEVT